MRELPNSTQQFRTLPMPYRLLTASTKRSSLTKARNGHILRSYSVSHSTSGDRPCPDHDSLSSFLRLFWRSFSSTKSHSIFSPRPALALIHAMRARTANIASTALRTAENAVSANRRRIDDPCSEKERGLVLHMSDKTYQALSASIRRFHVRAAAILLQLA